MIQDIKTRLITAIFFTLWVLGSLTFNEWTYYSLFLIICYMASYEIIRVESSNKSKRYHFLMAGVPLLLPISAIVVHRTDHQRTVDSIIAVLGIIYSLYQVYGLRKKNTNPLAIPGSIFSCILYIGVPAFIGICLSQYNQTFDWRLIVGIFALTWANDTGAYMVGSKFGKRSLAPAISPKKTIEGTTGGILFCIFSAWIISMVNFRLDSWQWIVVGLIVGLTGVTGDLIESKFKRYFGIKDSGTILPGHGGFLDRFDSLLFLLPFVYIYILFL